MYASLRTYRIGSGSVDAVMRRVDRDFAEALSKEPGFVAYHAIDSGNDMPLRVLLAGGSSTARSRAARFRSRGQQQRRERAGRRRKSALSIEQRATRALPAALATPSGARRTRLPPGQGAA